MMSRITRTENLYDEGAASRRYRLIATMTDRMMHLCPTCGIARSRLSTFVMETSKLNDVDPQAWLADAPTRIAEHSSHGSDELMPRNLARSVKTEQAA
jgi:IS66 C-terminal element